MVDKLRAPVRSLDQSGKELGKLFNKLSSGKRITTAFDDPAGLAIAKSLEADVGVSSQARRNISDGVSALQIADGAISQLTDIGGRLAELSAQASNGVLSDTQREALNNEFQQLSQEAQRITASTEFNGIKLFDDKIAIQAGKDGSSTSQLDLSSSNVTSLSEGLSNFSLSNQENARIALDGVKSFVDDVSRSRGSVGALVRRLDAASSNLQVGEENSQAARARIEDFDIAAGVAEKTASQIRQQIGASLSGQASRLNGQTALALLS
jgi:flagellin